MLVLIPKTVNGEPLTLNTLWRACKITQGGSARQYRNIDDEITKNTPVGESHWVLMTKNVIPESRINRIVGKQQLIENLERKVECPVPNADVTGCCGLHLHGTCNLRPTPIFR